VVPSNSFKLKAVPLTAMSSNWSEKSTVRGNRPNSLSLPIRW
jgi:hypothetical protein